MSSVPALLSAPGASKPSRAASAVAAKATRGFQVFRIDGYTWTKALPGGERISSEPFNVGGRSWHIDYYPNGTDGSSDDDSGSIALYLRMQNTYKKERVRAQYKFSLLDLAGNAAYELPAETRIFSSTGNNHAGVVLPEDPAGWGYAGFITKEDLEKRRDSLLKEDCLAIRCDVGVTELTAMNVGPNYGGPSPPMYYGRGRTSPSMMRNYGVYGSGYNGAEAPVGDLEDDGGSHNGRRSEPDDKEYIRRCLSAQRRK